MNDQPEYPATEAGIVQGVKDHERLRLRAQQALQQRVFDLPGPGLQHGNLSLDELVENLRTYHAELLLQNEELQRNERLAEACAHKFQALFEHAPLTAFVVNSRGLISDANAAAQQFFGLSVYRLCNTFFLRLFSRRSQRDVLGAMSRCRSAGHAAVTDVCFTSFEGAERVGTLHITALPEGDREDAEMVCILTDETEAVEQQRRLAQLNLQLTASESRFRTLVEDGSDILVTLDPDARFVYVAPSWFRVLGYSADGLVGRPCIELLHEDDRARFGEFLQAIFAGEADPGIEFRTNHADGAMRWIGSRARLATGDDGQAVVIATWRDVTKRRRAEDESLLNQLRLQELLDLAQRASDLTDDEILELALVKSVRLTRSGRGILEVFGDAGERKAICWPDTNWNPSPFNGALSWGSDAREASGSDADSSAAAPDGEEPSNEAGVLWHITVPVIEGDRVRMVIRVAGKPENYDETDIRLLTLLAGDVLRIVERGKAQQKLRLSAKVFDSTAEGVLVVDGEFRIAAVNRAFTQITGYLESELLGSDINVLRSGCQDDTFYRAIWSELERTGCWRGELMNRRKSGEIYPVWLTVSSLADEQGRFSHFVAVFSDITAIKQSEEKLDFLAHHDPLTALPNRLLFDKRLELALVRARRKSRKLAVLFMDLDRFKGVNDSLGHPVGDALLQSLAKEVRAVLRGEDMIARIGGDEFVVLLEDLAGISDAMHVLNRLTAVFAKPIRAGSHELYVTLSIGISVYPADGTEAYELVRNADAAMYLAKMEGRNTYRFYNPEITAQALERLRIETDLRKALNEGGLSLHFQPQIELESGRLLGAEVLARWTHEDLGAISPTRFIPVAEESGLIGMLGTFVLNCACRQLRRWRDAGFELPGISVNLSVAQIERQNVAAEVESALLASGLTGGDLELEITESVIMRHTDRAIDMLNQLRNLGVHLAIDDFGSGFSSLNYLKRLPIQTLKIDRSFINNIGQEANDEAIVRAVLALSANLNLRVVAEGVETEEQARFLQEAGCQDAQGFLYSKPLPADAFAARFQAWPLVARRID